MQAIVYYLTLPILYGIAYLPFWWLYRLSDLLYVILYYGLHYRKRVIYPNLRRSFPEKTEAEIKAIAKTFYRYFCDLIFESLKTLTVTPSQVRKRVHLEEASASLFRRFAKQNQSVVIVMGHWGNWELAGARFALEPIHHLAVIYHPLKSPYFERLVVHMRTRLGNRLYAMKETVRCMVRDRRELIATAFIADQTPSNPAHAHWMTFLQQDTPVFLGPERLASKFKYPVIYIGMNRLRRGYYEIKAELLAEHPEQLPHGELTERHTRRLEQDIRRQPATWLWAHRRWKHTPPSAEMTNY